MGQCHYQRSGPDADSAKHIAARVIQKFKQKEAATQLVRDLHTEMRQAVYAWRRMNMNAIQHGHRMSYGTFSVFRQDHHLPSARQREGDCYTLVWYMCEGYISYFTWYIILGLQPRPTFIFWSRGHIQQV